MGMFFFFFVFYTKYIVFLHGPNFFFCQKWYWDVASLIFLKQKYVNSIVHLIRSNKLVLFYLDEKKTTIDEFNLKRKVIRITWRKYI